MPGSEAGHTLLQQRSSLLLVGAGGLLGAAGVALAAAGSHDGGGPLAATAGEFCVMHGGTTIAIAALDAMVRGRLFAWAGVVLVLGTVLFAGDLAAIGLAGWRPLPLAAPTGGIMMIAGWGLITVASGRAALQRL